MDCLTYFKDMGYELEASGNSQALLLLEASSSNWNRRISAS